MIKNFFGPILVVVMASAIAWGFFPPPGPAQAQFVEQSTYGGTSAGTANAQTITIANYSKNMVGVTLRFVPGFTNTGPTQINVSSLGLVNVVRPSSIGNTGLSGGELLAGELTCVVYNGTAYQLGCNVDMTPIGRTVEYRGSTTPRGTLIEDGSCISRTTFAGLFSVIGTTYGACDGSTTFALPDSRGTSFAALDTQGSSGAANRITSAGSGCNATVVGLCGSQSSTLVYTNLPGHTHNFSGTTGGMSRNNPHEHTYTAPGIASNEMQGGGATVYRNPGTSFTSSTDINHEHAFSGTTDGGNGLTNTSFANLGPVLLGRRSIKY